MSERSHPWFGREACRGNRLVYEWRPPAPEDRAFWQTYGAVHCCADHLQAWRANPLESPDEYGRDGLYIFQYGWETALHWMRTGEFVKSVVVPA